MSIANCTRCRKPFQRKKSPLCPKCDIDVKIHVSHIYNFVQKNPQMSLQEISTHCNIPLKEVEELFFAGKLGIATQDIVYQCQGCSCELNAQMRGGRFCPNCLGKLEAEMAYVHSLKAEKPEKSPSPKRLPSSETYLRELQAVEPAKAEPVSTESYGFTRISEQDV